MNKEPGTKYERLQFDYYTRTADSFDHLHILEEEQVVALRFMLPLMHMAAVQSVLIVGSGTGRGISEFRNAGFEVRGLEPVPAMIEEGIKKGIPRDLVIQGYGQSIPFPDRSFDAVCSFGILHHVEKPSLVIREMLRVSRNALFLSDGNRFGQGGLLARLTKLLLWKTGLWPLAHYCWTGGKRCFVSAGDGIAHSYSLYDDYDLIDRWADRVVLIPTQLAGARIRSWFHPLLTASQVLLCAFKDQHDRTSAEQPGTRL